MVDKEIIIDGVDVSECSYGELEKYIYIYIQMLL